VLIPVLSISSAGINKAIGKKGLFIWLRLLLIEG